MHETDEEIQELLARYRNIEKLVNERLSQIFSGKLSMIHITHRLKTINSIKGKLERKPDFIQQHLRYLRYIRLSSYLLHFR